MPRLTIDKQNRLIFYNNPIGYIRSEEQIAVVDTMFQGQELEAELQRLRLTPRWENDLYDRIISGEAFTSESGTPLKRCRVWQLKPDTEVAMRFISYGQMTERFGEPQMEQYRPVYDGAPDTNDLEMIYALCRDRPPEGYRGHRMGLGDVVELYDGDGSEFYYCDRVGFQPIAFAAQEQTQWQEPTM